MNNKIIHGNCFNVLKKLKDESFDHCITDPHIIFLDTIIKKK